MVCHFLLQWTRFCQNSPPWPIHLGLPFVPWLIASLSYPRLWSMWSFGLAFFNCGFHSLVCGIIAFLVPRQWSRRMCFIFSHKNTKILTNCWTTINWRTLEPTKKDIPCPKTKGKPQWDRRRGTIMLRSNSIPTRWVIHKLENRNTKHVLTLSWSF